MFPPLVYFPAPPPRFPPPFVMPRTYLVPRKAFGAEEEEEMVLFPELRLERRSRRTLRIPPLSLLRRIRSPLPTIPGDAGLIYG